MKKPRHRQWLVKQVKFELLLRGQEVVLHCHVPFPFYGNAKGQTTKIHGRNTEPPELRLSFRDKLKEYQHNIQRISFTEYTNQKYKILTLCTRFDLQTKISTQNISADIVQLLTVKNDYKS